MRIISGIMNFYSFHAIPLQKQSNERSYKFNWILTLTEVISIRILSMRLIYYHEFLFGPMLLPFKNCPMNVLFKNCPMNVLISLAEFKL